MAASGMVPRVETYQMVVAATAAGADFEVAVCAVPFAGTVTGVNYIADTTLTGANTDSRTLSLINKGQAGLGTTSVASKAFVSGTDGLSFARTVITLTATAADKAVAAGDVLAFKSQHVGSTGLADPGGTVEVTIARD